MIGVLYSIYSNPYFMNNGTKKNKFITFLFFTIICIFYICESGSIESYAQNSFFGGDLVCYDLCLINGKSVSVLFPIISSSPINDISLKKITNDDVSDYLNCTLNFKTSDSIVYKKYYINFFTVTFSPSGENQSAFSSDINSMMLSIDDHEFEYKTPNFTLCNSEYMSEEGKYTINSDTLTKVNDNGNIFSETTSENELASNAYTLSGGAFFISLSASKFYELDKCYLDGTSVTPSGIYSRIDNKNNFSISYSFNYNDKKYENCITKAMLILKYQQNCDLKMYISNNDLYVYPNYSTQEVIKSYIDRETSFYE